MKILLATDGSEYSEAAVEEIASRPFPKGTQVRVVSALQYHAPPAIEPFGVSREYYAGIEREARQQSQTIVEAAAAKLRAGNPAFDVTTAVLQDSPKRSIVEDAETWKPDLIVVGSHGRNIWQRAFLGSVSQSVVVHAPCSVEIVRCRAGVRRDEE